jgi:hypothetical protein
MPSRNNIRLGLKHESDTTPARLIPHGIQNFLQAFELLLTSAAAERQLRFRKLVKKHRGFAKPICNRNRIQPASSSIVALPRRIQRNEEVNHETSPDTRRFSRLLSYLSYFWNFGSDLNS